MKENLRIYHNKKYYKLVNKPTVVKKDAIFAAMFYLDTKYDVNYNYIHNIRNAIVHYLHETKNAILFSHKVSGTKVLKFNDEEIAKVLEANCRSYFEKQYWAYNNVCSSGGKQGVAVYRVSKKGKIKLINYLIEKGLLVEVVTFLGSSLARTLNEKLKNDFAKISKEYALDSDEESEVLKELIKLLSRKVS